MNSQIKQLIGGAFQGLVSTVECGIEHPIVGQ
jgi:hypothetical protein